MNRPLISRNGERAIVVIVFVALVVVIGLLYGRVSNTPDAKGERVVAKIRRVMVLPEEVDQVLQIQNVEELRRQNDFYKAAENGHYVVITQTKAILYDDEQDMIIDVAPVTRQPATPPSTAGGPPSGVQPGPESPAVSPGPGDGPTKPDETPPEAKED